ncbi:MAG: DUF2924 domain-containing protein [Candidatus Aceula meridiana]|nr:DUF2924 domain-containing protein [Candidatus Aceula meridiana]
MNKCFKERLSELIAKYDPINNRNLCPNQPSKKNIRDYRLPIPGTTIHKKYKGQAHIILVLKDNFEYKQRRYKSLSAIARKITGSHWNGYGFFGLEKR